MTRPIVIFGCGQIAKVFHHYITSESGTRVAAFTVDGMYLTKQNNLGLPVVDFETLERSFPPEKFDMLVAVSFKERNVARQRKVAEAYRKGYRLAHHVSPKAFVWVFPPASSEHFYNGELRCRTVRHSWTEFDPLVGQSCRSP